MIGAILLAVGSWDPDPWVRTIRAGDPDRSLHVWPDLPDPGAIGYALVWEPPDGLLQQFPNMKVIFSLGAGVDRLVSLAGIPAVPLVRVVNPDLTQRMTEWITLQVLIHHRRQRDYDRQQASRLWGNSISPRRAR